MLATVIVIVLGAVMCVFIAALDGSGIGDLMMMLATGGGVLIVVMIIWYRYGRRSGTNASLAFWNALSRNPADDGIAAQYRPRKVDEGRNSRAVGTNRPITAEEAHDIQSTSANTWVPSRNRDGGK